MDHIRDHVLPLATIRFAGPASTVPDHIDVRGSCCLLGGRGFALTAAHVIDQLNLDAASVIYVQDGSWYHTRIVGHEKHPTEDVGVIQFAASSLNARRSFFAVGGQREHASCSVEMWGYPRHVTEEVKLERPPNELPQVRPDLIFFRGYVRRRIPRQLPISFFRGQMFYELDIVAGEACSGAPLIVRRGALWDVVGVYVGENTSAAAYAVGYAATADSFADWKPVILGRSISDEASTTARS